MQMREILPICRADSADLFPTGDELAMLDQDLIEVRIHRLNDLDLLRISGLRNAMREDDHPTPT